MSGTSREDIQRRAYQIWEQEGRPHGRHVDHWLQAEREFSAGFPTAAPVGEATKVAAKDSRSATPKKAATKAAASKAGNRAARMPRARAPKKG